MIIRHFRKIVLGFLLAILLIPRGAWAQKIDWPSVENKTVQLLHEYLRIDTCNPPGDVSGAAEFLSRNLEEAQVPVQVPGHSAPSQQKVQSFSLGSPMALTRSSSR